MEMQDENSRYGKMEDAAKDFFDPESGMGLNKDHTILTYISDEEYLSQESSLFELESNESYPGSKARHQKFYLLNRIYLAVVLLLG